MANITTFDGKITGNKKEINNFINLMKNDNKKFRGISLFSEEHKENIDENNIKLTFHGECTYSLNFTFIDVSKEEKEKYDILSLEDYLNDNKNIVLEISSINDTNDEMEYIKAADGSLTKYETYDYLEYNVSKIIGTDLESKKAYQTLIEETITNKDIEIINKEYNIDIRNFDEFIKTFANNDYIIITKSPYLPGELAYLH